MPVEFSWKLFPRFELSPRFDPTRALDHLKSLPMYEGQAVYAETLPGREGEFADTRVPIHPEIKAALLGSKGVTR